MIRLCVYIFSIQKPILTFVCGSMTGRFILSSGYGIQVESADDPFVSLSETWIKTISHATQRGGYLGMLHT